MSRKTWAEVQELLKDAEFLDHCTTIGQDPATVLNVASYKLSEKCSHPIHLNRIHPETGECAGVVVACENNNAYMCLECSEFKRRLRASQIMGTLDRPNVDVLMLTLTAPSFGAVHRATWNVKDDYRARHLDDAARYRKRISVQKSRKVCDCKIHHSYDEPLIGTPLGAYDYVGEVLWSSNLPRLMNSTSEALKYRAKLSGIKPENFRTFTVYERQKRGSLHTHILIVADNSPEAFKKFAESYDTTKAFPSPSAAFPAGALAGLEVGFERLEEDTALLASLPKNKRSLEVATPMHKGKPATVFGRIFDLSVLEADDVASVVEDADFDEADFEELPDVVEFADEEAFKADMPQHKSFKRAAGYVAKYLTKNNSAFSPNALRDLSSQQRAHFSRFRKTAALLYTDKLVFDAVLRSIEQEKNLLLDDVATRDWNDYNHLHSMGEFYRIEEKRLAWLAAGVTRTAIGDQLAQKLVRHTLTSTYVMDLVKTYESVFSPLRLADSNLLNLPARYLKMKLNRVANNAGFTGSLVSTHNWIHSLKDLKENRKALYFLNNPEAEIVDYIWELATDDAWNFDAVKFRKENGVKPSLRFMDGMSTADWFMLMNGPNVVTEV